MSEHKSDNLHIKIDKRILWFAFRHCSVIILTVALILLTLAIGTKISPIKQFWIPFALFMGMCYGVIMEFFYGVKS